MAGIFRQCQFGTHSTSTPQTPSTPNKRYSVSAFCTSPGTLQDVTMDNSYAIGYRSPCVSLNQYQGNASPGSQGGRSVREFEETLANLRKENFNLKLRLYFVEESIPGYHQALNNPDGPESIMKQLIDTKVETEVLRKELQEKQELLKDAAAAISLMDKKSQESEAQSNALIEELKQKVKFLEDAERNATNNELMDNILGRANLSDNMHALQKVRELEGLLKQSDERVFNLQNELSKFNELLSKRNETIQELEEKVKEQAFQNAEISEQLEMKEQECQNMERTLKELRRENSELVEKKRELTKAYECKKSDYQHEKFHINECQLKLRQQHDALTKLRSNISIKSEKTTELLERLQNFDNITKQWKWPAAVSPKLESPLDKYFIFDTDSQDEDIKNYSLFRYMTTDEKNMCLVPACEKATTAGDDGCGGDAGLQAYVPVRYALSTEDAIGFQMNCSNQNSSKELRQVSNALALKKQCLVNPCYCWRMSDVYFKVLNVLVYCTLVVHFCCNLSSHQ